MRTYFPWAFSLYFFITRLQNCHVMLPSSLFPFSVCFGFLRWATVWVSCFHCAAKKKKKKRGFVLIAEPFLALLMRVPGTDWLLYLVGCFSLEWTKFYREDALAWQFLLGYESRDIVLLQIHWTDFGVACGTIKRMLIPNCAAIKKKRDFRFTFVLVFRGLPRLKFYGCGRSSPIWCSLWKGVQRCTVTCVRLARVFMCSWVFLCEAASFCAAS